MCIRDSNTNDFVGAADTITFDGNLEDYGYSLNSDVITFGDEQETTRHGKDLDKLDGPE